MDGLIGLEFPACYLILTFHFASFHKCGQQRTLCPESTHSLHPQQLMIQKPNSSLFGTLCPNHTALLKFNRIWKCSLNEMNHQMKQ